MPPRHQGPGGRVISRRQGLTLLALTLMWGVNWPVMKLSLREITPLYFRALTMTGGALWLYFFYRARGLRMLTQGSEWRSVIYLGLPNMLGWHTVSILGVKELASGRAAILGFTMPIWTVLISVLFLGEKLTRRVAFAATAVAIAITLLISHEFTALTGRPLGIVWMEIAAVLWAIGTLSATLIVGESPQWQDFTAIVFVMAAIAAVLLAPRFKPKTP